jgi:adenylate cyclase
MRSRRLFSYPISLAVVVATLVMVTGGWIAWWNYRAGVKNARSLAGSLFDRVAQQTADATGDFLMRAPPAAETLRGLALADAQPLDTEGLARRMLPVLRANPGFTWVSFSDETGAFTGVYRTADGKLVINHSEIIAGKTVLDERDAMTGALVRHADDTKYDPRKRDYYILARDAGHAVWAPPYVFAEGLPGITYAAPHIVDGKLRGVFTVDFDLRRLSDVVKSLVFSEHGRVAVISDKGLALAHPTAALTAKGELVQASALPDPALRAKLGGGDRFSVDGTPYLARSLAVPLPQGPAWQVIAYAPESDFTAGLQKRVLTSLLISLAAVIASVVVAWILARRVSGPLTSLAAEMAEVGDFQLGETPRRQSLFREIEMMNAALARMKGGLRSFARYVPRDLVRAVLRSGQDAVLAGDVRVLTVYFSDLAGFTSIAETMKPDELVRFLGGYLHDMSTIIAEEHGTVDKFLGDGIMAFWGAPNELANHASHACAAALRCHQRVHDLAKKGTAIRARIGIATGDVLVGNIGSPERMNYTVMGDTANLAARLESLNKQYDTQLMISEATYEQAKATVVARPIDLVAVKGKKRGIRVYELLALKVDANREAEEIAAASEVALDAYLARDFAGAVAAYERILAKLPGDYAAEVMRDRAQGFVAAPPAADWDGVTLATEK